MLEQIKEEAELHINTVRYLMKFPDDIADEAERYWVQIQYLLDRLEIVDAKNEKYREVMELSNRLYKELKR